MPLRQSAFALRVAAWLWLLVGAVTTVYLLSAGFSNSNTARDIALADMLGIRPSTLIVLFSVPIFVATLVGWSLFLVIAATAGAVDDIRDNSAVTRFEE